jgi:CDP-diacylglycerol--serine O-phosphatidyltransferase
MRGAMRRLRLRDRLRLGERLIDPRSPDRRPRRAAYVLPALFTAGNLFLGYLSIMKSFEAVIAGTRAGGSPEPFFEAAAKAIGIAVFLDGLDGNIARLTGTVSDFGRELDSLADIITFGLAPAVLAFAWGVQFVDPHVTGPMREHILRAGYFLCFLFLLCGAARLARFNVQVNPQPKNPGRTDRKYFVGLPIPGAAAMVAAVVFACGSSPIEWWPLAIAWLAALFLLSFLMVSRWRYRSFKEISLVRPRSPISVVLLGSLIYLIWTYPQPVLLGMAVSYVSSGILIRIGGAVKRKVRPMPPHQPEAQAG